MKILIYMLLHMLFHGEQTSRLQVIVTNVKLHSGDVVVSIYNKKETFLKAALISQKMLSDKERLAFSFELPPGIYAITIYQDINNNGKLDFGFLHKPKEPVGFGNNFKARFSAPDFDDCMITVNRTEVKEEIKLY